MHYSVLTFLLGILGILVNNVSPTFLVKNAEDDNIFHAEAVQGGPGRLPCNITSSVNEDRVTLVIWYKEEQSTPIYSFDARHASLIDAGSHHEGNGSLGGRSYFNTTLRPAALVISTTKGFDTGLYRCRVDFQKSPTRNTKIQLNVIVPPETVQILNEKGVHIPHYILGPYNEGASINITCVSTGGRPLPKVTWWRDNVLLNSTSINMSEKRVKNILQLDKLERKDLHNNYVCQSTNNNVSEPITSSVTLDLNLRPLSVKLFQEFNFLSTNSTYDLKCEVLGSRPAPTITWWMGSSQMRTTKEWISPHGNLTRSILSYHPSIEDQGKFMSCRAEQSLITDSGIEDGFKLNINHIPVVTLEYGTNQQTTVTAIREGADVYFECNIKSNPWVYRVTWRHNGKELTNMVTEGIIVSNQSLVLQNVSRARIGGYTCVGSNSEGDGISNQVHLDIQFAPLCRPGQITSYNVGRGEIAKIQCEVEASPTDITFSWKFNTSLTESIDIVSSSITNDKTKSIAHYKPMTKYDYGTLVCWGENELGVQTEPCVFHVIPAGKPEPLSNCTILNQTFDMFQIACNEGFDGGLSQEFIVELFEVGQKAPMSSMIAKTPYFELKGLEPGQGYEIYLYARNKKGKSLSFNLQAFTLKNPEKQTDLSLAYSPAFMEMKPFVGTLLGILGTFVLIVSTIILVVRLKGSRNNSDGDGTTQIGNTINTMSPSMQNGVMMREMCNGSVDSIEKNPDIIPHEKKADENEEDEWLNNNRMYATAVMAEQQLIGGHVIPTTSSYDRTMFSPHDSNCLQQHMYQQQMPNSYIAAGQMIPVSIGYVDVRGAELTYADLSMINPNQKPMFTSATLGRPRHNDFKRAEPNIYAQIDLAQHHTSIAPSLPQNQQIHQTNLIFSSSGGTFTPISQYSSFPPPPRFSNQISELDPSILQTVQEMPSESPTNDRVINHTSRF